MDAQTIEVDGNRNSGSAGAQSGSGRLERWIWPVRSIGIWPGSQPWMEPWRILASPGPRSLPRVPGDRSEAPSPSGWRPGTQRKTREAPPWSYGATSGSLAPGSRLSRKSARPGHESLSVPRKLAAQDCAGALAHLFIAVPHRRHWYFVAKEPLCGAAHFKLARSGSFQEMNFSRVAARARSKVRARVRGRTGKGPGKASQGSSKGRRGRSGPSKAPIAPRPARLPPTRLPPTTPPPIRPRRSRLRPRRPPPPSAPPPSAPRRLPAP